MDGIGQPDHTIVCCLVNILGGLVFGFCAVGVNTALTVFYPCALGISFSDEWTLSALVASVTIGAMIGALGGGELSDKIGRKWSIAIAGALASFSAYSMYADTYVSQFVSRVVVGLGVGLASTVCGSYVSEMAPPQRRGALGALFQVFITVGILGANIACYFIMGENRDMAAREYCEHLGDDAAHKAMERIRILFIPTVIIPATMCCLALSPIMPESYEFIRRKHDTPILDKPRGSYSDLLSAKRPLVIALMGAVALQLTGINAVMFYCSKFLDAADVKEKILGTVIIMAWNFVTTLLSLALADRLGRRPLLIPALAVITVSMVVLCPISQYTSGTTSSSLAFVLLGMYILAFEVGPGCLFWVICNEIFPEHVSAKGFSLINMVQWLFTLFVTFSFSPLQKAMGGYVFWLFGIPGGITTVFMLFCLPETKGKTKQDITLDLSSHNWVVWSMDKNATMYEVQNS
eukprot:PhM_4_TR7454/c0_g1_i3/m.60942